MDAIPNADPSSEPASITNTFGISGHANVTNIGRITYEILDEGTAAGTYEKVASIDERLRVVHDSTATNNTLGWLAAPDPSANYVAARGKHQSGTGIWFNQRADFREWKNSPGTVLCIYGAPGSGKTILSSSIVEEVKALCESRPLLGYAYFYFDSRSAEKGLLLYNNLIRSLLTQLSSRCNGVPAVLQELYRNHGGGREQPSLKSLHETLQRVMEGFDHIYIVIDSLDECGDRSELLHWITSAEIWGSPNLHLLVTSRPEHDIRQYLDEISHLQRVIIEGSLSQQDIEIYLDARLAKIKRWSKATREAVKKKLMESADGMFRWVALQLDDLEHCFNSREIKAQLEALPKDLEETYERILSRSPRRCDLLQLLHWLAFSARALSLEELAEIVSVDLEAEGCPSYDAELRYDDPATALTVCAGLITETDGQVKLAHFSVKEFLISEHIKTGVAAYFSISEQSSHSIIAQTCLAYLLIFNYHEEMIESTLDSFPLAFYAAQHWIIHFRAARDSSHAGLLKLLLSLFDFELTSSYAMINWVRLYNPDKSYGTWSDGPIDTIQAPMYYAALLGLTQVVECLLGKGNNPNACGMLGTALSVASRGGHLDIIKLLLEGGAEVNARGWDYGTALRAAVSGGHLEITQLLLESGAELNAKGWDNGTALRAASSGGHLEIAQLLLESGAEVNAKGWDYGTALLAASSSGHLEIAQLLLESGAEVNDLEGDYEPALQVASFDGHLNIVQLLLESGAEVNAQGGGYYVTALQAASHSGHLEIAQLLLEQGAEVNAWGGKYDTALRAASCDGHLKIAKLLLESGAEVNVRAGRHRTALGAARHQLPWKRDKSDLVLLLLAHGALEGYEEEQEGDSESEGEGFKWVGEYVESEEEEEYFEAEEG